MEAKGRRAISLITGGPLGFCLEVLNFSFMQVTVWASMKSLVCVCPEKTGGQESANHGLGLYPGAHLVVYNLQAKNGFFILFILW